MRGRGWPWLFLTPHLSLFAVFLLVPLAGVFALSLQDWNLLGDRRWIGLENYREIVEDRLFWTALGNTLRYGVAVVPLSLVGGLGLAWALNGPVPLRGTLRAAFYVPGVISSVAAATVAAWIFNDHYGVLNAGLEAAGLPRVMWLSSTRTALWALVATTLWVRVGFCMVVYLAALQDVPRELLDAARVDGAGAWGRFRHVTWPFLRRATAFLLVMNVIYSFHVFDLIYVMTGGGPAYSTTVLVQYLYEAGFGLQRQGYAAALSVALYGLMLALTGAAWAVTRKGEWR